MVRSGAERVIEGLLPTILSVGLNDRTVFGLARTYRDTVGAFELYLKFVCDYGKLVHHLDPKLFSRISPSSYARKRAEKVRGHVKDILKGLSVPRVQRKGAINRIVKLKAKIEEAKDIIKKVSKQEFPEDPLQQLEQVTVEVAKAWEREDVVRYRKYHGMSESPPAAVLIQEQANGKLGTNSGVAVVFSRDPATGEPGPVGWAKWKATGDEVMSGPAAPISERDAVPGKVSLERLLFRLARSEAAVIKRIISDVEHIYRQPMKIEIVTHEAFRRIASSMDTVKSSSDRSSLRILVPPETRSTMGIRDGSESGRPRQGYQLVRRRTAHADRNAGAYGGWKYLG